MDRIRVAIICHFSNEEVRDNLKFFPFHEEYRDSANWITTIINALRVRDDVDLHIVAPHRGIYPAVQEFKVGGVSYHFFRRFLPAPFDKIERRVNNQENKGFPRYRKYISQFLHSIKPDIVNLIGAENAYYASSVLDINNIPVFVHCQTVYANPERKEKTGKIDSVRWNTELAIFHRVKYFACSGQSYYHLIKGYEPDAIIFPRRWPRTVFPTIENSGKRYDFVFWARFLNKNKGFDNAIEAIGIVKKKYPQLKVLAIGTWKEDKDLFKKRILDLGLEETITILPSFPQYEDVLRCVKQARFALLPIKMDYISGTILEAFHLGLPVVTCRTSGTPLLNERRKTVLLSDIGDNEALADNMLSLITDSELDSLLEQSGYEFIKENQNQHSDNIDVMVEQYRAIIEHYYKSTPIPESMLFKNLDC